MMSWRAVLVYAVCLLAACFAQATPLSASDLMAVLRKSYNPQIRYNDVPGSKDVSGCRIGGAYITSSDPLTHRPSFVTLKEYAPISTPSKNRAVIVIPGAYKMSSMDQHFAQRFCEAGIRTVILENYMVLPDGGVDLASYDRQTIRAVIAIRHAVTMLIATGSHSVGILGTGMGATQAAFETMIDSRVNTAAFVLGGLGLADILATTTDPEEAKLRQYRMEMSRMSAAKYSATLQNAVRIDATTLVSPALRMKKSVVSVIATKDKVIPFTSQMRLYEAFGRQGVIPLESTHESALSTVAFAKTKILATFFLNKLAP